MRRGDYRAAHEISDAVLAARDPADADNPNLPYHRRWVWDGSRFAGKHVLVRCYHGLGDTLQFARFLPELGRRAASLTVEAQPELMPLLRTLPGGGRVVPFRIDAPLKPAECTLEIMELLHAFRITLDRMPRSAPYLSPEPRQRPRDRTIGLCWQSGDWDPDRSIPLQLLTPALARHRLHCISLQRGAPASAGIEAPLHPEADMLTTATLVASLDLVITVDTMIAHLAGALGRPTWLLLKRPADWRWMDQRVATPWYPNTRLFRQGVAGDWSAPVAELATELDRLYSR
ncbi:MAG: hypothetical protein JO110_28190 [Acetobacteraceae bacterium]|nr:hypothetical protein [Acetobacteraceae bacterium]